MTDTRKKRFAKLMIDIASGEVEDREPTPEEQGKDKGAVERGHQTPRCQRDHLAWGQDTVGPAAPFVRSVRLQADLVKSG